ncbi:MAG TPA: site-2 protease family protein [Chloroflexia bacterium]|nr:site-2 protease family protein [Chloroflexia bacterium]
MKSGVFKIVTVGGVDIKAHWSWLLILLLFTYQLASLYFPNALPGESEIVYLALGLVAALLLFVSVLVHELSHAFTARARGLKVRDIVLFIFGGAANIEQEPEKPGDEFLIAVVGPLTSIALAGIFYGLALIVDPPTRRAGAYAASVLQYLALINFMLALFNMIPGFPLDGGRVLRSIIWGVTRNFQSATRIAGFIGQLVAYGFIFLGLYQTFFRGDFDLGGLWLAFIGWFLLNAAQQSVAGSTISNVTRGINVAQVMQQAPSMVAPHFTLAHLLTQFILPYNLRALPVGQDGRLEGIVTLSDIKDVPQDQWGTVTVGNVMTAGDKLRTVSPQDGLDHAMQLLSEGDFDQLPVVDNLGKLVGMLSRAHVLRWLQIRDELKLRKT